MDDATKQIYLGIVLIIGGIILGGLLLITGAELSRLTQELGQTDPTGPFSNFLALFMLVIAPAVGVFLLYNGLKLRREL